MAKVERLHTLSLDADNNKLIINGKDVSESVYKLTLEHENGITTLDVAENTLYTTNNHVLGNKLSDEI